MAVPVGVIAFTKDAPILLRGDFRVVDSNAKRKTQLYELDRPFSDLNLKSDVRGQRGSAGRL